MKVIFLFGAFFAAVFAQSDLLAAECQIDPYSVFKNEVLLPFAARVTSVASGLSGDHFVISPHTIWLSLASLAEFAQNGSSELWEFLYFPKSKCVREQIYPVALNLEYREPGIEFIRNRALAISNKLEVRKDWIDFSHSSGILPYLWVDYDEEHFRRVQDYMGIEPRIPLSGNSVFLDRLDWAGLWTSAFADGIVTRAPYYNYLGQEIAQVDYLVTKKKVRFVDIPNYDTRVLELPVGSDGRYSIILAVGGDAANMIGAVFNRDILSELRKTENVATNVVIPRLSLTSAMDLRPVLSGIGLASVFTDPEFSYISTPAASPMAYLHRVNVNLTGSIGKEENQGGLLDLIVDNTDNTLVTLLLSTFDISTPHKHHFVANRPFLFALYETKVGVPVFTGVYSRPEELGTKRIFE